MEGLELLADLMRQGLNLLGVNPEVLPAEPITKPAPTTTPRPDQDDPFNVPAPLVDPTPKGLF